MFDRQKAFSFSSSRNHCQRSIPSRISNTPRTGFKPAQNLSSGFLEWSCAVVISKGEQWGRVRLGLNVSSHTKKASMPRVYRWNLKMLKCPGGNFFLSWEKLLQTAANINLCSRRQQHYPKKFLYLIFRSFLSFL